MPEILIMADGEIEFQGITSPVNGAIIYVRIEDVSRADAPSRRLAEQVIRGINLREHHPPRVPFTIQASALDPHGQYVLRVHVDTGGNQEIKPGDYITTQSYPLSAFERNSGMLVKVYRVG